MPVETTASQSKAKKEFILGRALGKLNAAIGIIIKPPKSIDPPIRTFLFELE